MRVNWKKLFIVLSLISFGRGLQDPISGISFLFKKDVIFVFKNQMFDIVNEIHASIDNQEIEVSHTNQPKPLIIPVGDIGSNVCQANVCLHSIWSRLHNAT